MIPAIAKVIISLVARGRLKAKIVELKTSPPNANGSHPRKNIKIAFVAQDQSPSNIITVKYIFFLLEILGFLIKPKTVYEKFSAPQAQRRCCL